MPTRFKSYRDREVRLRDWKSPSDFRGTWWSSSQPSADSMTPSFTVVKSSSLLRIKETSQKWTWRQPRTETYSRPSSSQPATSTSSSHRRLDSWFRSQKWPLSWGSRPSRTIWQKLNPLWTNWCPCWALLKSFNPVLVEPNPLSSSSKWQGSTLVNWTTSVKCLPLNRNKIVKNMKKRWGSYLMITNACCRSKQIWRFKYPKLEERDLKRGTNSTL